MSSIWEHIIDFVTFDRVIMVATLVVAMSTLHYTRNRDKKELKSLIKRKQAQLKAMEMQSIVGVNVSEMCSVMSNIALFQSEIEQLKEQL